MLNNKAEKNDNVISQGRGRNENIFQKGSRIKDSGTSYKNNAFKSGNEGRNPRSKNNKRKSMYWFFSGKTLSLYGFKSFLTCSKLFQRVRFIFLIFYSKEDQYNI